MLPGKAEPTAAKRITRGRPPLAAQSSAARCKNQDDMVYLTRKAEFAASHYYHNPDFTPEENQRIFGKCNNPNGHGHNYTLEVTVKGEVDPRSGFVVDLKQLKEILHREVLDAMDHRFLNKEVPEFCQANSDHREPGNRHLAALGAENESSATASRARLRNARSCSWISTEKHEGLSDAALHVFRFPPLAQRSHVGRQRTRPPTVSATILTGTATTMRSKSRSAGRWMKAPAWFATSSIWTALCSVKSWSASTCRT